MSSGGPSKGSLAAVLLAGTLFGTIPVFTTPLAASGVNAEVQVAWRLLVGTPALVLACLVIRPERGRRLRVTDLGAFLGVGAVLLGLFLTYVGSLSLGTPAATAVLLLYSQPVFTVMLSPLLGERVTWTRLVALLLGVSGVLAVVNPFGDGIRFGLGEALALSSGFLYSVYIVGSRRIAKDERIQPLVMTTLSFAGALLLLVPVVLLTQVLFASSDVFAGIVTLDAAQVWLLLGLILFGTVIPYLALNSGLVKIEASKAGVTLLVEPVCASALGYIVLRQALWVGQVVGACLIFSSIILLNLGER